MNPPRSRLRLAAIVAGGLLVVCVLCVVVANLGSGKATPTPPTTAQPAILEATASPTRESSRTPPPTVTPEATSISPPAASSTPGLAPSATPVPTLAPTRVPPTPDPCAYIGNSNTHKFHYRSCSSVGQMNEENKVCFATRDDAIAQGYVPCAKCNP